ncbi:MAG: adenosylcobinamide-GDP ribazoletransferase, partial [Paracoccaceae bacterium]
DGLADCVDGFWGGDTPARRLEIMRDSQIGSYGVIALVMSLLLRLSLLAELFSHGVVFAPLLAAAVLSRVPMVALMHWLEPARTDGLSAQVGRPDHATTLLAAVLGLLLALLLVGFSALIAALVVALLGWAL